MTLSVELLGDRVDAGVERGHAGLLTSTSILSELGVDLVGQGVGVVPRAGVVSDGHRTAFEGAHRLGDVLAVGQLAACLPPRRRRCSANARTISLPRGRGCSPVTTATLPDRSNRSRELIQDSLAESVRRALAGRLITISERAKCFPMNTSITALAHYRVKPGHLDQYLAILDAHWPLLRDLELVTDREQEIYVGAEQGIDGPYIIEIFDWADEEASKRAPAPVRSARCGVDG